MSVGNDDSEIYVPTLSDRLGPWLNVVGSWVMNCGFGVAFLAIAYLCFGVLSGGLTNFDAQPHEARVRILANVTLGGTVLAAGLAAGAIGAAAVFFSTDTMGYILLGGAAAIGLGIPYGLGVTGAGQVNNFAVSTALAAFATAAYVPAAIGILLVIRDLVRRLISALKERQLEHADFTYGGNAEAAPRPIRTSLLAKCWEGPYCREFIRPHCPIFLARKACWREKRGCYCEEDIVSAAAAKINGVILDMAPDPGQNYANVARPVGGGTDNPYRKPQLSMAQKIQRCKYCVIFNEHERQKYQLLVPLVVFGSVGCCVLFASTIRSWVGGILSFTQHVVDRFSFTASSDHAVQIGHPNETIGWVFVVVFTIMFMSKALQVLEWACFKAKI